MGHISVRAARDDDDLDALHRGTDLWGGQVVARALFRAGDGAPSEMVVAELDGVPGGYASAVGAGICDGRRGMGHVYVLPDVRGQGLGTALWERVLAVCTPERVRGVQLGSDEADERSRSIALGHGLVARGLHHQSEVDLEELAGRPDAERLATRPGLHIGPLAAPGEDDEAVWRDFGTVYRRLFRDAPDVAEGADDVPEAVLRAGIAEPWQVTCARTADGRIVALTCVVVRDRAAGRLGTWFTGVDPAYRGRGLATAVKVAQGLALRRDGWGRIDTQNMDGNAPMLAVNERLGFRRTAARRDLTFDF